ncbi:hypothetical protein KI387_025567, partial [Taxus chinensis]
IFLAHLHSEAIPMFLLSLFRRPLFAAVNSEATAAAFSTKIARNPLEEFFEADRSLDDEKPNVYGRGWKAAELRLKSWDDLQKLWYVLLKEKNMLMSQRQMLQAQNMRFPNPERIPKGFSFLTAIPRPFRALREFIAIVSLRVSRSRPLGVPYIMPLPSSNSVVSIVAGDSGASNGTTNEATQEVCPKGFSRGNLSPPDVVLPIPEFNAACQWLEQFCLIGYFVGRIPSESMLKSWVNTVWTPHGVRLDSF